jgi:hypothetical protein
MSDNWVPPGYIDVTALARRHGVDSVRNDLFSGRLRAFKWDEVTGTLFPFPPSLWGGCGAEQLLEKGLPPDYRGPPFKVIVRVEDELKPPPATDGVYLSPFMVLMLQAVRHFEISEQRYPKKKVLEEHFRKQKVDGTPVSANLASQLATLCRPPAAKRGGNTKG